MKQEKPKFYALYKDFNNGCIKEYDVLDSIWDDILDSRNKIKKSFKFIDKDNKYVPVTNKQELSEYLKCKLLRYWGQCEWEFLAIDWPNMDTIEKSRPVKIDVYEQLKPNLPVIIDLVWNYIEPKLNNLK